MKGGKLRHLSKRLDCGVTERGAHRGALRHCGGEIAYVGKLANDQEQARTPTHTPPDATVTGIGWTAAAKKKK